MSCVSPSANGSLCAPARLAALGATALLDAPAHAGLDRLAALAARLMDAPTALVSLVGVDRQFFTSCVGLAEPFATTRETPLSHSFCQHVVASRAPLIVSDAREHPVVCDNLAIPDLGVIAYAGMPLRSADGEVLGSFCVIDQRPREWSANDLHTLEDLAGAASAELQLLVASRQIVERTAELQTERQQLADLLDATEKLVCTAGPDGRITYVNRAWCVALGYSSEDAARLRPVDLVAPEHRARYVEAARRLVAGETVTGFEAILIARDGRRVVCRGRAVPVMETTSDGERRCVGTRAFYGDVTAEYEADVRRGRLLAMLDASADFVATAGPDGRLEYLNAAGRQLLGVTADADVSRLAATDFHTPATIALLDDEALPTAARDGRWRGEGALRTRDGEEIPVSMVVVAHPSLAPGGPPSFSAVMRDLRERVAAEAERERERAFLRTVLDSLSENVSVCAPDGRLTLFNRATLETHGLPADGTLAPERWSEHYSVFEADGVTPFPTTALPHVRVLATQQDALDIPFVVRTPGRAPRTLVANAHALRGPDGAFLGSVCAARDMTEQVAAERALRESEGRLALIYNGASDLMFLMRVERDAAGAVSAYRCESVNDAYLAVTGLTLDHVIGHTVDEILPRETAAVARERYAVAVASGDTQRYDEAAELPCGRVTVETTLTPVHDEAGRVTHLLGVARDVSGVRRAEAALRESEARFRGVMENLRVSAVQLDTTGCVTFINDALLDLTGWSRADVLGTEYVARFVPGTDADRAASRSRFADFVAQRLPVPHYESEIVTRAGERRRIAWDNVLLLDPDGAVAGTASVGQDVTERRALEARLAALSEHDELTALLNRRGFRRAATQELKSTARTRRRDAVLYLDLDCFKPINDTHGHATGDAALCALADVVRRTIRDTDFAARMGGDEFAIYAIGLAEGDGDVLASRLLANLEAHNALAGREGRPYRIECSVGVAESAPGEDLDAVLARADAALYVQKVMRRRRVPA